MPGAYAHSGAQMPEGVCAEPLVGVGQALAQRELAQSRIQQRLERMRQRSAEQLDGVGVDELAKQWAAAVPPQRGELVELPVGLGYLTNTELPQRFLKCGRLACAQPPVGQPVMHARQAVGVVQLRGDHRCHAECHQMMTVFVGKCAQHPHQRQVGRRPRLVEPFLADRPATVMGQPRQVGVQNQGEESRDRLTSRPHRDRDQVQAVVDIAVARVGQVEIVGAHRRDVAQQVFGPRRVGKRAGDLRVDDRTAVLGCPTWPA